MNCLHPGGVATNITTFHQHAETTFRLKLKMLFTKLHLTVSSVCYFKSVKNCFKTNFIDEFQSPEEGAMTPLYLCCDPEVDNLF